MPIRFILRNRYHSGVRLSVVLPVFNEADGIEVFLRELQSSLENYNPSFIVVDDHSTDATYVILKSLLREGFPLRVHQNDRNMGHGYSCIKGLELAIAHAPSTVMLCDGDGQFDGSEIRELLETHINNSQIIVEGVRLNRREFWFRKLISFLTRLLTAIASHRKPRDANTPLRIYPLAHMRTLFYKIPDCCTIPNLALSSISRTLRLPILEIGVRSLPPRRLDSTSHWKQRYNFLPSKRLIKFVYLAFFDWLQIAKKCAELRRLNDTEI